jgi:hypothetical protein
MYKNILKNQEWKCNCIFHEAALCNISVISFLGTKKVTYAMKILSMIIKYPPIA